MVVEFPEQIVGLLIDAKATVGVVLTVIVVVIVFALKHPAVLIPFNV